MLRIVKKRVEERDIYHFKIGETEKTVFYDFESDSVTEVHEDYYDDFELMSCGDVYENKSREEVPDTILEEISEV